MYRLAFYSVLSLLVCVLAGCPTQSSPTALFLATPLSGPAPLLVQFFDVSIVGSTPIDTRAWSFGNGQSSAVQNPSVRFDTPGNYNVSLTVSSASGSDTLTLERFVTVFDTAPVEGEEEEGEGLEEGEGALEGEGFGDGEGALEGEGEVGGDTTPPAVVSTSPAQGSLNARISTKILVSFSEAMLSSSIGAGAVSIEPAVSGSTLYGAGVLTFTPSEELAYDTLYTVTVSSGLADLSGNTLGTPYVFNFRTIPQETTIPLGFEVNEAEFVGGTPVVALMSIEESAVFFVDTTQGLLLEQHNFSNEPQTIKLHDGSVYATDVFGNFRRYDALTGTEERTFSVGTQPFDIAFSSDGRVYVSEKRNLSPNVVFEVYDLETLERVGTTLGGYERETLRITPDESEIWGLKTSGSPTELARYSNPEEGNAVRLSSYRPENKWEAFRWFEFDPTGSYLITDRGDRMNLVRVGGNVTLESGTKLANLLFDLLFDVALSIVVTTELDGLHVYDLDSQLEIGFQPLNEPEAAFIGWSENKDAILVVYEDRENRGLAEIRRYPLETLLD